MNGDRPTLNDPAERELIRKMYFKPPNFLRGEDKDIDPIERLDRMQRGSTTNQAR